MLSAYLYRVRRAALKQPWKLILVLLFIVVFGFMLAYPTLMSMPNSDGSVSSSYVQRDLAVVTGGMYLILLVMFNFMFFTGLKNGVVGFSTADVNFHMAGPFTPRFNLIIAASGTMQICLVFTFFLSTQTAIIYKAIGVSSLDLIAILVGAFLSGIIGYFAGSYFGAMFCDDEKKKNGVTAVAVAVDVMAVALFAVTLLINNPSITGIGVRGVIAALGESPFVKAFPGAGWVAMIYDGVINGSLPLSIAGIALTSAAIIVLVIIYQNSKLNYYDEAIAFAQKAADLAEQKRAGVDADTAAMTRKAKVGKERLGAGEGASAFTAIHFLMNKRGSKVFFINPLSITYRVITGLYLGFMSYNASKEDGIAPLFISAFMMMILLNAVLYAGGKTVMEFTEPFVYLVPETSNRKLLACLKADVPEMIFDSILCGAIMMYFCKFTLTQGLAFAVMMIIFDLLCEMAALLIMRLLPSLGRHLLMFVRYMGVIVVVGIASIPIAAVYFILKSMTIALLAGAGTGLILLLILTPIASVVVARSEM